MILCLGHQNPSLQQLVFILKMLQVKKKSQWKEYNSWWQAVFPRYYKKEKWIFSLCHACLLEEKAFKKSHPHPQSSDQRHLPSVLHPAVQKAVWGALES